MNTDCKKKELTPDERAELIKSKRSAFADAGKSCLAEYDGFAPCEKCGVLGESCHKACGVIMKHVWRNDDVKA